VRAQLKKRKPTLRSEVAAWEILEPGTEEFFFALEHEIAGATTRHVATHATGGTVEIPLHECESRGTTVSCQAR
jgi:hypothetical protein